MFNLDAARGAGLALLSEVQDHAIAGVKFTRRHRISSTFVRVVNRTSRTLIPDARAISSARGRIRRRAASAAINGVQDPATFSPIIPSSPFS
jgi:hypothetical protein